jgi:hypothetical protein
MRPDKLRATVFFAALSFWGVGALMVTGDAAAPPQSAPRSAEASASAAPTFSRDVAPIFYNKCVGCHRPGEVAPMSLITYRDVRPWASAIREKVTTRVMPPWHADRQYGSFRNDLSLTQREIDTIAAWVKAGASEGNPSEMPALPKFPDGWQIGQPDQVFQMQAEYQVPASGTIDYQYFEVPTNFTEDKWMQAGEVRAGDRSHVHHIIVYVREPKPGNRPNVVAVRPILSAGQAPAPAPAREPGTQGAARSAAPGGGDAMLVNWAVGEDAPVYLPGTRSRSLAHRFGLREGAATSGDSDGHHRKPDVHDPAGRCEPRGRSRGQLLRQRQGLDDAPAYAPAGQGHDLHGDLSRRP